MTWLRLAVELSRGHDKSVAVDRKLSLWIRLTIYAETKHNYSSITKTQQFNQRAE